jgi:hypothetical protein
VTDCFIQLDGEGLRIPKVDLRRAFRISEEIRERILEFVQEQALGVSQLARLPEAPQIRRAASALAAHGAGPRRLRISQLHARVPGYDAWRAAHPVTLVAGALQRSGLIEYHRGKVKILDRENLEEAACDCYRVTKQL